MTGRFDHVRRVEKSYLAIVRGTPESPSYRVDLALRPDESPLRVKMRVCDLDDPQALAAATRVEVLGQRQGRESGASYALVRCHLESGRQHQIRVHLAATGTPVLGDKLYGGLDDDVFRRSSDGHLTDDDLVALIHPRHALHAERLVLFHPDRGGERVTIEAPLAADFERFLGAPRHYDDSVKAAIGRLGLALAVVVASCKGEPDPFPWCSAGEQAPPPATTSPTYYADVKPFVDQKCGRCHVEGGIGPFALSTFNDVKAHAVDSEASIVAGRMPPFLAEACCNTYFQDYSLTADEIAIFRAWNATGTIEGDPATEPETRPRIGGVSRSDVELAMDEPYTPNPRDGTTDDLRCFVLDWPYDKDVFVTGLEPLPGTRDVVHHLIVAAVSGSSVDEIVAREGEDGDPGFDCSGGFGGLDIRDIKALGGSLLGGDFPRGIGHKVEAGSKILLNLHYSTVKGTKADKSAIRLRVDDEATEAKTIPIANPAWLVAGGMEIEAGEKDAKFYYRMEPDLYTRDVAIEVQSITPHMHEFATKLRVLSQREDGETTCLLEIGRWHFGWEQPFWLDRPLAMGPDDELYLECHFDNSAANQPGGGEPRDIAWGDDNQDMCAAFVSFTEASD